MIYVYVYTVDPTGELSKYCRMKPNSDDPKTACLLAASGYLEMYAEDFGCDFREATLEMSPESCELRLSDHEGEDARMYFSTDAAAWELHKTGSKL